jgi:hypothetical protein
MVEPIYSEAQPPSQLGVKVSDKVKFKIRRTHIKNEHGFVKNSKPIKQYTLKGKYLTWWRNAKEVEICWFKKKIYRQVISRCARGERQTAYGFIWKYD